MSKSSMDRYSCAYCWKDAECKEMGSQSFLSKHADGCINFERFPKVASEKKNICESCNLGPHCTDLIFDNNKGFFEDIELTSDLDEDPETKRLYEAFLEYMEKKGIRRAIVKGRIASDLKMITIERKK